MSRTAETPRDVDPEIAESRRPRAGEAAHEGHGDGEADGRGDEVLHGEPHELHRVADRHLGGVALPIRVRDEADRGVERERLLHGREAERVGQHELEALHEVDGDDADRAECEHAPQVHPPTLLDSGVDADEAVDEALGGEVARRRERAGHVVAERAVEHGEYRGDGRENGDGRPCRRHQNRSGFTRAYTR
jgi:hypothetical protein